MAGTNWNITKMDEGFIRPQAMVGPVVMNGAVHTNLCNQARREKAPYYPHASSTYSNNQSTINHGDIVFTLTRPNVTLNMGSNSTNAIRLQAVAILNGHGKASDGEEHGHEVFMENVTVLGIAEVPYTPNNQGYFNILRGGIFTVRNNSKWTIQVGDYLMAYAPKLCELKDGGAGKEADRYGEAKLWFKTFDPLCHSLCGKQVYRALRAGDNSGHLPKYVETCKAFMKSAKGIAMTVMACCFKKMKRDGLIAAGVDSAPFLDAMVADMESAATTHNIEEKLFVLYSGPRNDVVPGAQPKNKLNKMQRESTDLFFTSASVLHHYVKKNVIGQAMSTADPQRNFSIQMINYGM